ncbi:MAG TPA: sugar ABC transporter permease [Roseiarcus sp.]|nr:sugar ABC transporter permease [Roseiarcus sp.]
MASVADAKSGPMMAQESPARRFFRATEIDTRLLGMVGALILIWIGFQLVGQWRTGEGVFLTPRNLWNLLVQTSAIAVMSTGMVMIIVMRHIDLSVGSMLSFIGVVTGVAQAYWLAPALGSDHPIIWIIAVIIALGLGALLGAFNGFLVAYAGIPSFIVTLGGLIVYNGAAWWVIRGETVAPMDSRFELIGGTPREAWIGGTASWALGVIACVAIVAGILSNRVARRRFRFPQRPIWAEIFLAGVGCFLSLGAVFVVNSYYWPPKVAESYAKDHNIPIPPEGLNLAHGFAIPMLIAFGVGVVMTFIARRTTFGRYIYALGGNPEAADLAGINTRWITLCTFSLMGVLVGISACISAARLDAASNSLGQFDELYVIAATVIGGTSLAGGLGTIYGAMLGALVMQSLQSGMTLLNFDSAVKDVIVGSVLVFAVWIDQLYRRRQT